ncbi:MAG: 6,7-dimethyl-8-ribityllumazine synthase [Oligoflexales bacterium]|nr:6,7-dimethyl-8-ribityllumazine synthase [Oligoflexales bacterium]
MHEEEIKILIVASEFNSFVTNSLVEGARAVLKSPAALEKLSGLRIVEKTCWVPGAFELPSACAKAASLGTWDAIIALGCVIQGETPHFQYICQAVAQGLCSVGVQYKIPVIFGVLTTDTVEQALARSRQSSESLLSIPPEHTGQAHNNNAPTKVTCSHKGEEAAQTALSMIRLFRNLDLSSAGATCHHPES